MRVFGFETFLLGKKRQAKGSHSLYNTVRLQIKITPDKLPEREALLVLHLLIKTSQRHQLYIPPFFHKDSTTQYHQTWDATSSRSEDGWNVWEVLLPQTFWFEICQLGFLDISGKVCQSQKLLLRKIVVSNILDSLDTHTYTRLRRRKDHNLVFGNFCTSAQHSRSAFQVLQNVPSNLHCSIPDYR